MNDMSTQSLSHQEANLAAEVRATEEGHKTWATGTNEVRVVSDTTPGLSWLTSAQATHVGAGIVFHCRPSDGDPTQGHGDRWSRTPGRVTCKHCALLARRLEAAGLARWDAGMWVATEKAAVLAQEPVAVSDAEKAAARAILEDPFSGLG